MSVNMSVNYNHGSPPESMLNRRRKKRSLPDIPVLGAGSMKYSSIVGAVAPAPAIDHQSVQSTSSLYDVMNWCILHRITLRTTADSSCHSNECDDVIEVGDFVLMNSASQQQITIGTVPPVSVAMVTNISTSQIMSITSANNRQLQVGDILVEVSLLLCWTIILHAMLIISNLFTRTAAFGLP